MTMTVDYSMRISRLTVDKMGVKLYDKVSAVIAELVANAYDADAENVIVRAPMGQYLASRKKGRTKDKGFDIEVVDDGNGMTPQEVQDFFLVIGAERRKDPRRGDRSPRFKRMVMGRKGVGKLAPFGICKTIELISAGGDERVGSDEAGSPGYLTSHIVLSYDGIVALGSEPDERYKPTVGDRDQSFSPDRGTTIILRDFNYRKVPDISSLGRQLSQRFGITSENWAVELADNTVRPHTTAKVGKFDVDTMPNTKLTFREDGKVIGVDGNVVEDLQAGFDHEGKFYSVDGWMAYSKAPYRDDLMAGVRIYCRKKIAAQTHIFNQRAGFTGEHNIRSYLVGELNADWLDKDEDLIQTDRRDILWSDELAETFQEWGRGIVKRIGTLSRNPTRKAALELFLETGDVQDRIAQAFPGADHDDIRSRATDLASSFGRTISRGEAEDPVVVKELSITLAPHVTLNSMMREAAEGADKPLSVLGAFLQTARLAELSSFGRIAEDRLKVIDRLECLKGAAATDEGDLQVLITGAPWLVNPEWAPVTENQSFTRLRGEFEKYYEEKTGTEISLSDFRHSGKRPDFVLSSQEGTVQIIEIKRPKHTLSNTEMDRIVTYYENMEAFLDDPGHGAFRQLFRDFHVTVVCDDLGLTGAQKAAYDGYVSKGKLTPMTWSAFLLKTEQVHQDFLDEARRQVEALPAATANGG